MKKILTVIIALSIATTVSAKPFSMADYKDKTGAEVKKVGSKKTVTIAQKILNMETQKSRLEIKLDKIVQIELDTMQGFAERSARLARMDGDKAKATKSLAFSRKAKVEAFKREKAKIKKQIEGCGKLIKFYERKEDLAKEERSLRIAGILKSSVSV